MKPLDIRQRILLAALIPALLVATLVSGLFVIELQKQAGEDQHRRLKAIAQQIASLAEYDLFVGYREGLGKLAKTALQDPDIVAAAILDANSSVLASTLPFEELPYFAEQAGDFSTRWTHEQLDHWHAVPIKGWRSIDSQDLFSEQPAADAPVKGWLLLKVSNAALDEDGRVLAIKLAGLTLFILLFALLLAWALSRRLVRMLVRISHVVDQTGQGIGGIRIREGGPDELGQLAEGIDKMIGRVESNQAELAAQVQDATAELRQEKEAAEAASLARSRFFAAASHDLRQPVQALGLFAARLRLQADGTPLEPALRRMLDSVLNLQGLLNTLLDYSRLDGQVFRIEPRAVNARTLVAELVNDFAHQAAEKRIALRMRLSDGWLMTDASLLRRLLLNLLGNAVRHTRHGSVLVACRRRSAHMRIEVWDTGPGIPGEHHETIFEELFQLDNPERDPEKGLGLGLAIVRRTADLLCHPIRLCSRVGHGSCFSVLVPLTKPPAFARSNAMGDEEPGQILVIGPEDACGDVNALLDRWQFEIYPVEDVAAAQAWCLQHGLPDCLIHVSATGGTAFEQAVPALDRLEAELGRRLPTLFISNGPLPDAFAGDHVVGRHMLSRPFPPARLRAMLTHLLEPVEETTH